MITRLNRYSAIGWDFDETLFGHPVSELFHRFIKENPNIDHHIITFRSHGWEDEIEEDLKSYGTRLSQFKSVINISDDLSSNTSFVREMRNGHVDMSCPVENEYLHWKAKMCKENGIPVLIDDDTNMVIFGCERYGIDYFHPDDFDQ